MLTNFKNKLLILKNKYMLIFYKQIHAIFYKQIYASFFMDYMLIRLVGVTIHASSYINQ